MSKSKKEGNPKKNRGNVVKKLKLMNKNNEILSRLKSQFKNTFTVPHILTIFIKISVWKNKLQEQLSSRTRNV